MKKIVVITHNHSVHKYAFNEQGSFVKFERGHKYTKSHPLTPRNVKRLHIALSRCDFFVDREGHTDDMTYFVFKRTTP